MTTRTKANDRPLVERDSSDLRGKSAYEADLKKQPTYPDGGPRKPWDELDDLAQWSWNRPPNIWSESNDD